MAPKEKRSGLDPEPFDPEQAFIEMRVGYRGDMPTEKQQQARKEGAPLLEQENRSAVVRMNVKFLEYLGMEVER